MSRKPTTRKKTTTRKPSVSFSQPLFDEMMVEVMVGKTVREICSGNERPNIDTFYYWLTQNAELSEQYKRAREAATDTFEADILIMAATTDPDNATAHKARFEMLRWVMARRAPKRYGDKQQLEHSGPDGGPVQEIRHVIVDPRHDTDSPA